MSKKKPSRKTPDPISPLPAAGGGPMDLGLLEKLVRLMHANDLTCVEVADGERRILLKRGGETVAMPAVPTAKVAPAAAPTADAEESNLIPIKSAMVGTFYAAASPDAAPFVRVGSAVEEETDVCVIEAMKVFNTVKAECKGTIARILVTNGQAVEFGQALFLVKGT